MKKTLALTTALGLVAFPALADVNLLSWGGAYGNSHVEAYAKPFEAETGIKVNIADADNPATPIKAMVEAGKRAFKRRRMSPRRIHREKYTVSVPPEGAAEPRGEEGAATGTPPGALAAVVG